MAKTPNISKTQIPPQTPQVSVRPQNCIQGAATTRQTSGAVPSNSRGTLQHGTSTHLCRRPLDGDASAQVVEAFPHTDCTCGVRRQNYDLIAEMPLRPLSGDPSFQDWRCCKNRTTQHATRAVTHTPTILQPSQLIFLDSEPKCHETAGFRLTDRQKTSITRMSMPSGLNGKDTKQTSQSPSL